jgi:hypothetical protein
MSGIQKVQQMTPHQHEQKRMPKVDMHQEEQQVTSLQRLESSAALRPSDVLSAQKQVGNQVVQRALDNRLAREASTDGQGNLLPEISKEIQKSRGSGNSLPGEVKSQVSKSFKKDFSNVRLHTDEKADQLSRSMNARAFTIGSDIYFKKGVYNPSDSKGRDTLLHELTHVVQQSSSKSSSGTLKLGAVDSVHEKEADHTAKRMASVSSKISAVGGGSTVQKQEEEEIQTQAEEEEVQTEAAPEEEEVQTQAEGGVVQRNIFTGVNRWIEDKWADHSANKVAKESGKRDKEREKNHLMQTMRSADKGSKEFKSAEDKLRTDHTTGLFRRNPATIALKQRGANEKEMEDLVNKTNKDEHEKKAGASREVLLDAIKNPQSSPEQVKAAEEKLKKYHSRFGRFNYSSDAISERRSTLEKKAGEGDEGAQKNLDALNASNPSKKTQVKNFFKDKVGGFITGTALPALKSKLSGMAGDAASSAAKLAGFGGGGGSSGGASSGGGGGGGGMLDLLAQEVMDLKKQVAALSGGTKPAPTPTPTPAPTPDSSPAQ